VVCLGLVSFRGKGGIGLLDLDQTYMNVALHLARAALGQTSPNPVVGAVLVKNNQIVGLGSHLRAGDAHAEIYALRMAGDQAKGATLYVTLEPCNHHGKTPPCTEAVVQAGVKRVVIAAKDPNPLVSGRGIARLKEAGLEVEVGLGREEAERLNEVFNYYIVHRRPFVTLKTATTLDGKIATAGGESQWITGQEARRDVHLLRRMNDAILVGINTVLRDNPRLTARLKGGARQPIRIVLDSSLKIPLDARLLDTDEAPTWIFTTHKAPQEKIDQLVKRGARVFITDSIPHVDIGAVLSTLGKEGVTSLLVEGGGKVNASFLRDGYVNKLIAYLSPKIFGGDLAPGAFGGQGVQAIEESVMLKEMQIEKIGEDIKIVGYF
jgi:diaminohydroxyphosphoribosylaminopyrimidine deaminase/5-amino-6-(5-phosphoribosylamino)uracil reductase